MIRKNWAYTHSFKDVVELVAECGGKEIQTHLLTAPKNATYLSPEYVSKMIEVMADYVKQPLHSALKTGNYTFFSDETTDVTSIEQFSVYATFCINNTVSEHFIGLIPIGKEVGASLTAPNIMAAIENFFLKRSIPLRNARFACMDTTNVNSGERGGLKRYLEHNVPLLRWIGCNNHKLALCFKHLIPQFSCIFDVDAFLVNIWKHFKYRPLAMSFLENSADIYGEDG